MIEIILSFLLIMHEKTLRFGHMHEIKTSSLFFFLEIKNFWIFFGKNQIF
jgi:hypothetical protein